MPFKRVTLENAPDADANKRYGAEDDIQSTQAFEIRIEVVTQIGSLRSSRSNRTS